MTPGVNAFIDPLLRANSLSMLVASQGFQNMKSEMVCQVYNREKIAKTTTR